MVSATTSRRDAAPTPHPRATPLAFAPVRRPRHPPPEAGRNSRPCSSRGLLRPATRRSRCPRHAPTHHARPADRTRPPSVRRSVRDLPPSCVVLWPGHHAVVTIGRAVLLSKRSPLHHAPPDLAPAVPLRRRGCRWQAVALHRLWATAHVSSFLRTHSTSPSHTLPSVRPPLAGTPSRRGCRRRPSPCAHADDSSAPTTATTRP
jgi:hypothetical protein